MNILDFLVKTGIPEFASKGKVRNLMKSRGLSLDRKKLTDPDAEVKALCFVESVDLGEFLAGLNFYDEEIFDGSLRRLFHELGFVAFKEHELFGVVFENYFVVSKGKKEHWLVRTCSNCGLAINE